jgi:transposase
MTAPLSNDLRVRAVEAVSSGEIVRARLWFLPSYSPDLNPIEQALSKIKYWMLSAQKKNIDDTWQHIGRLVETIQPTERGSYLKNAGYDSDKK